jgi:hypothetical protein
MSLASVVEVNTYDTNENFSFLMRATSLVFLRHLATSLEIVIVEVIVIICTIAEEP